jgi:hypothetical protein
LKKGAGAQNRSERGKPEETLQLFPKKEPVSAHEWRNGSGCQPTTTSTELGLGANARDEPPPPHTLVSYHGLNPGYERSDARRERGKPKIRVVAFDALGFGVDESSASKGARYHQQEEGGRGGETYQME